MLKRVFFRRRQRIEPIQLVPLQPAFVDDDETAREIGNYEQNPKLPFSPEVRQIDISDVKLVKCVYREHPASSTVYHSILRLRHVALKLYKRWDLSTEPDALKSFEESCLLNCRLSHPAIVQFEGVVLGPTQVATVTEYCKFGDLESFLVRHPRFPLPERLRMLAEITDALVYLDSSDLHCGDLRPRNVVLDAELQSKLIELQFLLRRRKAARNVLHRIVARGYYIPPEAATSMLEYDIRSDVYSFGVTVWVVLTGNFKPYGPNPHNVQYKVRRRPDYRPDMTEIEQLKIPEEARRSLTRLIPSCWTHDPGLRPTFSEIRSMLEEIGSLLPQSNFTFVEKEE